MPVYYFMLSELEDMGAVYVYAKTEKKRTLFFHRSIPLNLKSY